MNLENVRRIKKSLELKKNVARKSRTLKMSAEGFQLLTRNFFFGGGDLRSQMMRSLKEDKLWIEQMTVPKCK